MQTNLFVILIFSISLSFIGKDLPSINESYTFRYSKYDKVGLNGTTVVSKSTFNDSGSIRFYKNQVVFNNGGADQVFKIEKYFKQKDGYQINTWDSKGVRCVIGVINRQGIDFVVFHYIDNSYMLMHHITSGFNLNMKIYN